MKKLICIILVVVMTLATTLTAFASEDENFEVFSGTSNVSELDGGYLFTTATNEKIIAILTNHESHLTDISIVYLDKPNIVYQWKFNNYSAETFSLTDDMFWQSIIKYAEDRKTDAELITVTECDAVSSPQLYSSAGADLIKDMEKELGNKYSQKLLHTQTVSGNKYRVYQSLDFRVNANGNKSWSKAMTVTSLITGVLGLTATSGLIKAICGIFGVTATVDSMISGGKLNKYNCFGMQYRSVTVNGSKYVYNITDKFYQYMGYENADNNSKERAYIDTSSKKIEYTDGKNYYNSYTSQIDDAKVMFDRIGQQS